MSEAIIKQYRLLQKEYLELTSDPDFFFKKSVSARVIFALQNQNYYLQQMSLQQELQEVSFNKINANLDLIKSIKYITSLKNK